MSKRTAACMRGHVRTPETSATNGQCKLCIKIASKLWRANNPSYRSAWRKKHRERLRTEHIGYRYGIAQEDYDNLITVQENACAIRGEAFDKSIPNNTPHVDHCHETGRVRGLLCRACNSGLGQFKDNETRLSAAIKYLGRDIG